MVDKICYRIVLIEKESNLKDYYMLYIRGRVYPIVEVLTVNIHGIDFEFYIEQVKYQGILRTNETEDGLYKTYFVRNDVTDVDGWVEIVPDNFCKKFYSWNIPEFVTYGVSSNLEILKEVNIKIISDIIEKFLIEQEREIKES